MTAILRILAVSVVIFVIGLINSPLAAAQALATKPTIVFKNFNGQYHLSRDAQNHSLLTSEEVILADFPDNGNFYGITRAIPKTYQGRSVNIKVLNVEDASGSPVPFKTSSDKSDNLVITTGDPAITLYGLQTFRFTYQTRDVVDLNSASDNFLLDVNGRGWDQSFAAVSASLFIPKTFASSLLDNPSCYIGYLNSTSQNCSVGTKTTSDSTQIDSKTVGELAAHHALVLKLKFRPATFSNSSRSNHLVVTLGGLIIAASLVVVWRRLKTS